MFSFSFSSIRFAFGGLDFSTASVDLEKSCKIRTGHLVRILKCKCLIKFLLKSVMRSCPGSLLVKILSVSSKKRISTSTPLTFSMIGSFSVMIWIQRIFARFQRKYLDFNGSFIEFNGSLNEFNGSLNKFNGSFKDSSDHP